MRPRSDIMTFAPAAIAMESILSPLVCEAPPRRSASTCYASGMLSVNEVTQGYGGKLLFDNVNVTFSPGRRFGLTGPNGAGKSTFMKFLAGDAEPQKGTVSRPRKTSILRQDQFAYEEQRVLDVVIMGNKRLWAAMTEKDVLLK